MVLVTKAIKFRKNIISPTDVSFLPKKYIEATSYFNLPNDSAYPGNNKTIANNPLKSGPRVLAIIIPVNIFRIINIKSRVNMEKALLENFN